MIALFWILFFLFFYAYFGYAILMYALTRFVPEKKSPILPPEQHLWPEVCLFVTAYNERTILKEKVENCFDLNYPREKMKFVFVTDGSTDGSDHYLRQFDGIIVYHEQERKGKINAMNRGMEHVSSDIVVFTDANTHLNKEAIMLIAGQFMDEGIGCVAGRKRVVSPGKSNAAGAGEGLYWKFESWLKKLDDRFYAPVGAVGELFAIRRTLFEPVAADTILDDMVISFSILSQGYRLTYLPEAVATETASFNVKEELKRKIRISAGGLQTMFRLSGILNPLRNWRLAFQFFSHKVSRWTFAPWCLFLLYPVNLLILCDHHESYFWWLSFFAQNIFYLLALSGWASESFSRRFAPAFLPYYFTAINLATIKGQIRYFRGKQSAAWDKAKRMH